MTASLDLGDFGAILASRLPHATRTVDSNEGGSLPLDVIARYFVKAEILCVKPRESLNPPKLPIQLTCSIAPSSFSVAF